MSETVRKGFIERHGFKIVSVAFCLYILFFSAVSLLRYEAFDYTDFDFAIYAQIAWNLCHGSIFNSILGIPFLGNHLDLIMFLIAPFYFLFPFPPTLLIIQTISIGLGALAAYLIARDLLGIRFAVVFSLLYLFYPALHFVNYFEFHAVAFAVPFLLFMFYFFEKKKTSYFFIFMFLSLMCKENIAAGIFAFGLYILLFRRQERKTGYAVLAISVIWLLAAMRIMAYFNKGTIDFGILYSHFGRSLPEAALNTLRNPAILFKAISAPEDMMFIFKLFFPLAFISIFAPKILFVSVPFFLQQLLSSRLTDQSIEFHYTAYIIPFIFISAIYGMRFLLNTKALKDGGRAIMLLLAIATFVSNINFGLLARMPILFKYNYTKEVTDYKKQSFVDRIPRDAPTIATFEFLPKLSQRSKLYSFHHIYKGTYTLSGKAYFIPEADYTLIDFNDYLTFTGFFWPDGYTNVQYFLSHDKWGLVEAADNVALFKKGYISEEYLSRPLKESAVSGPPKFLIQGEVACSGYNLYNGMARAGEVIHLNFTWESLKHTDRDYIAVLKLVDKDGNIIHGFVHPICYGIYPTHSWKEGDLYSENIWISLPSKVKARELQLKMGVGFRDVFKTAGIGKRSISLSVSSPEMRDSEGWINLGKVNIGSTKEGR